MRELTEKIRTRQTIIYTLDDSLFTLVDEIDDITRKQEALKQTIRDENATHAALRQQQAKAERQKQQEDEVTDEEPTDEMSEIVQLEQRLEQLQRDQLILNRSKMEKEYKRGELAQEKEASKLHLNRRKDN